MKAILADLLLGSVVSCLIAYAPARADTTIQKSKSSEKPVFLSAKVLQNNLLPISPLDFNFAAKNLDSFLAIENPDYINNLIAPGKWLWNDNSLTSPLGIVKQNNLSLGKRPLSHQNDNTNIILGFHPTFWPSSTGKYWGLTTVEQWGYKDTNSRATLKLGKKNLYPLLPAGLSTLTVSGGGGKNLVQKDNLLGEFKDFRGGVALHRGLSGSLTLGMGFVYEQDLRAFSQLSFQPQYIPLKTTFSLISRDEGLELHSHLRFQPAKNFVFNFHSLDSEQKFDLNWGIISGLNLLAKGNSERKSLNAGLRLALKSSHFAFAASAGLDNRRNWHWDLKSQLGDLKLKHKHRPLKTNSELSYAFFSSQHLGLQCSLFLNYQTRQLKRGDEYLSIWGGQINSGQKLDNHKYRWTFNLGYGSGSQGKGIVASTSFVMIEDVIFKISYEEISVTSNEPKLKLEIGSK